jgi:hypothetical protein
MDTFLRIDDLDIPMFNVARHGQSNFVGTCDLARMRTETCRTQFTDFNDLHNWILYTSGKNMFLKIVVPNMLLLERITQFTLVVGKPDFDA